MSVDNRLNYLDNTKSMIRLAINNAGGVVDESIPFSSYPNIIQNIIDAEIIPQSTLNAFVNTAIDINGENANRVSNIT